MITPFSALRVHYKVLYTVIHIIITSNVLRMNVIQLIARKFSENEVVDVKKVLCRNSGNQLTFQVRKDSQYRSEKFVHVEDIITFFICTYWSKLR